LSSILILGGTILTMESKESIIQEGFIYIEDDRIVDVGHVDRIPEEYKSAELILNAKGRLITPGLIAPHTHLCLYPIRYYTSKNLDEWVEKAWRYESQLDFQSSYYIAKLALYTLLKRGITCIADMHFNMESVAKAISETGIYADLSVAIMERGVFNSFEEGFRENIKLAEEWHRKNGRINVSLGPCSVRLVSRENLEKIAEEATKRKLKIHMHISEVKDDVEYTLKNYGLRPVELLERTGILNTKCILAHGVWLSQREIHMLKGKDVTIVLNPITNILMETGIPPIVELLKADINLSLGIDVSPRFDVLDEAFTLKKVSKMLNLPVQVDSYTLMKMVTVDAAKALDFHDKIGTISKGKRATITIFKMSSPEHWPLKAIDIYDVLVYGRPSVETVIVDGEVLVDGGEVLVIDDNDVLKGMKVAETILNNINM